MGYLQPGTTASIAAAPSIEVAKKELRLAGTRNQMGRSGLLSPHGLDMTLNRQTGCDRGWRARQSLA